MISFYDFSFLIPYVFKIRFVRQYINNTFFKALDKANKYKSEKHMELKKRSQKVLAEGR